MSARQKNTSFPELPQVVGTIHSPGALRRALRLQPGQVDLVELRVDHFPASPDVLFNEASRISAPKIVTVRHPDEGGAQALSRAQRRSLFERFLPLASYLDIELRSCVFFADLVRSAKETGIRVIVSDHHFKEMPSMRRMRERRSRAQASGADLFKLAAMTSIPRDLALLMDFLTEPAGRLPLSVMGMGPLGKISRLAFACAGSVLNYGYLDKPQVPGQWEAAKLKARIAELRAEA